MGTFSFGCFGLFLFVFFFFFSLVRRRARADTKIWLVTKKVIASCILRVLTKLLLLFPFFLLLTMLHIVHTLFGFKEPLYIYFSFLFFPFLLFSNLWLVDFLPFLFRFLWSTFITQGKISFFLFGEDLSVLSSNGKVGNFHPRSRLWPKHWGLARKAYGWRDMTHVGIYV